MYALWWFWWLDSAISYAIAFGMLYIMWVSVTSVHLRQTNHPLRIVRQEQSLAKMTAVWLLPVVTLVVASSTGGLVARALRPHSVTLALITTTFSFVMVLIGLSLALMIITVYLLRLITYGAPDATLILSAFIVLGERRTFPKAALVANTSGSGPLGQGGYSLLVNGENMAELLPLHFGSQFPFSEQVGQMIFVVCFAGAFILWSMGIAWIALAVLSIFSVVRKGKVSFSMAYWGMVFPHGTFAILSVQLAKVLDSSFYRVFGALWCCKHFRRTFHLLGDLTSRFEGVVFSLWAWMFTRSIPPFIDGSLFKAPYVPDEPKRRKSISEVEKGEITPTGDSGNSTLNNKTKASEN